MSSPLDFPVNQSAPTIQTPHVWALVFTLNKLQYWARYLGGSSTDRHYSAGYDWLRERALEGAFDTAKDIKTLKEMLNRSLADAPLELREKICDNQEPDRMDRIIDHIFKVERYGNNPGIFKKALIRISKDYGKNGASALCRSTERGLFRAEVSGDVLPLIMLTALDTALAGMAAGVLSNPMILLLSYPALWGVWLGVHASKGAKSIQQNGYHSLRRNLTTARGVSAAALLLGVLPWATREAVNTTYAVEARDYSQSASLADKAVERLAKVATPKILRDVFQHERDTKISDIMTLAEKEKSNPLSQFLLSQFLSPAFYELAQKRPQTIVTWCAPQSKTETGHFVVAQVDLKEAHLLQKTPALPMAADVALFFPDRDLRTGKFLLDEIAGMPKFYRKQAEQAKNNQGYTSYFPISALYQKSRLRYFGFHAVPTGPN